MYLLKLFMLYIDNFATKFANAFKYLRRNGHFKFIQLILFLKLVNYKLQIEPFPFRHFI